MVNNAGWTRGCNTALLDEGPVGIVLRIKIGPVVVILLWLDDSPACNVLGHKVEVS